MIDRGRQLGHSLMATLWSAVAVTVLAVLALLLTACGSATIKPDAWFQRAQSLTADSVWATSRLLTIAGNAYKAEAARCTQLSAIPRTDGFDLPAVIDPVKLHNCMQPANEGRDKIETAATIYRTSAIKILEARSWADVLAEIPALRNKALAVANIVGTYGGDAEAVLKMLVAPLDEAEGVRP